MPVKVEPSQRSGGVEVPTMEEFNALVARVNDLEAKLADFQNKLSAVESSYVRTGDKVSLFNHNEFLTWMTSGGEVKSRPTSFIPEFQAWLLQRR